MLPPRGFGAMLLLSFQRCIHLATELTLTPKCSAASCRDAHPDNLTQVTGVRLWHRYPPRLRINAETITHSCPFGNPLIQISRESLLERFDGAVIQQRLSSQIEEKPRACAQTMPLTLRWPADLTAAHASDFDSPSDQSQANRIYSKSKSPTYLKRRNNSAVVKHASMLRFASFQCLDSARNEIVGWRKQLLAFEGGGAGTNRSVYDG
jgi:hypothetical protein